MQTFSRQTKDLPVDEADQVVDGGLGAPPAHFAEESVVGHQQKRTPSLTEVHVKLACQINLVQKSPFNRTRGDFTEVSKSLNYAQRMTHFYLSPAS